MTRSFFHVRWCLLGFWSVLWWGRGELVFGLTLQGTHPSVRICKAELSKAREAHTLQNIARNNFQKEREAGWEAEAGLLSSHTSLYLRHPGASVAFTICHGPGQTTLLILISSQEQRAHLFLAFFNCVVITHLQNK